MANLPDFWLFQYPAGYPVILLSGIRPDIRQVQSDIRPDTGYQKSGLSGRLSGTS
jgi:hypothetical protein